MTYRTLSLITAAVAAIMCAAPAMAQNWTAQRYGGTTYYNGYTPDGGSWNGNSQRSGDTTFSHFYGSDGSMSHCTSTQTGGTVFTNCY